MLTMFMIILLSTLKERARLNWKVFIRRRLIVSSGVNVMVRVRLSRRNVVGTRVLYGRMVVRLRFFIVLVLTLYRFRVVLRRLRVVPINMHLMCKWYVLVTVALRKDERC